MMKKIDYIVKTFTENSFLIGVVGFNIMAFIFAILGDVTNTWGFRR